MEQTEVKQEPKVIEVPVFVTDDDIKKMVFLIHNDMSLIKEQLNEVLRIAKE